MSSKSRRIARKQRKALKHAGLHFKGFGGHSDRRNDRETPPLVVGRPRAARSTPPAGSPGWEPRPGAKYLGLLGPLHEPACPDQAGQPAGGL